MTAWTMHVKQYAEKNGVSYKEAMTAAKGSYTKAPKTTAAPAPAADMPKKPRTTSKKEETKMPATVKKAEKRDELASSYEKGDRVEKAKRVSKKKAPMPLMI